MGHGRMDRIAIDLDRPIGAIDRNVFGGFVEHLGRCVYGGIFEPGSPRSGPDGLRADVLEASRRLRYANVRYPGGNFVSAYRWRDGVGPVEERPARYEPGLGLRRAQHLRHQRVHRLLPPAGRGAVPGRECRGWRHARGARLGRVLQRDQADGAGAGCARRMATRSRTACATGASATRSTDPGRSATRRREEYARTYTEYAKVMRWADPGIKLLASAVSFWEGQPLERIALLLEQAAEHIDYLGIHWYVGDPVGDVPAYLAVSELIEERLRIIEGLSLATTLQPPPEASHPHRRRRVERLVQGPERPAPPGLQPARGDVRPRRRARGGHALQRLLPPRPQRAHGQHRAARERHRADDDHERRPAPADHVLRVRAVRADGRPHRPRCPLEQRHVQRAPDRPELRADRGARRALRGPQDRRLRHPRRGLAQGHRVRGQPRPVGTAGGRDLHRPRPSQRPTCRSTPSPVPTRASSTPSPIRTRSRRRRRHASSGRVLCSRPRSLPTR